MHGTTVKIVRRDEKKTHANKYAERKRGYVACVGDWV